MKNIHTSGRQHGISLVELMVGIAISLILLAGVLTLMLRMSVAGGESIESTRLNQQLRGAMDKMAKDIQRAGYVDWWHAWDDDNGDTNPVDTNDGGTDGALIDTTGDGNINVLDFYQSVIPAIDRFGGVNLFTVNSDGSAQAACTADCNCILFSYDLNEDGAQGVASGAGAAQNTANRELFGYRLVDGEVQMRWGGGGNANACTDGDWVAVTESAVVEITALNMGLAYAAVEGTGNNSTVFPFNGVDFDPLTDTCTPTDTDTDGTFGEINDGKCLWRRSVSISLSGRLVDDTDVTLSLSDRVKIKNDYLQTTP